MEYVFISYSVKDKAFVSKLNNDLNLNGVNTWVDIQQINPGEMWKDSLEIALRNANLIIVVLSENSLNSNYVLREFTASIRAGKRVITIKIGHLDIEKVPNTVKDIQWLDFTDDYQNSFDRLLKNIPSAVIQQQPITSNKQKSKGYIFLSYAEEDDSYADELKVFLKHNQFAYWDYQSSERNYHSQFFLELESVIEDARATLSVITSYWKTSVWATREYFFSEEIGTPVYLLKFQPTKPILAISGQHYFDFFTNKPTAFTRLSNELKRKGL
jgi:hypothetical protein